MGKIPNFVEEAQTILNELKGSPAWMLPLEKFTVLNMYCLWSVTQAQDDLKLAPERKHTRKEVADLFRISLPTLDKYLKLGIIRSEKIGSRILITSDAIKEATENIQKAKHLRLQ